MFGSEEDAWRYGAPVPTYTDDVDFVNALFDALPPSQPPSYDPYTAQHWHYAFQPVEPPPVTTLSSPLLATEAQPETASVIPASSPNARFWEARSPFFCRFCALRVFCAPCVLCAFGENPHVPCGFLFA